MDSEFLIFYTIDRGRVVALDSIPGTSGRAYLTFWEEMVKLKEDGIRKELFFLYVRIKIQFENEGSM